MVEGQTVSVPLSSCRCSYRQSRQSGERVEEWEESDLHMKRSKRGVIDTWYGVSTNELVLLKSEKSGHRARESWFPRLSTSLGPDVVDDSG